MKLATMSTLLLCCCATAAVSAAEPVYRCGNSYSQAPCAADARVVDTDDSRTEAQRAEARRVDVDERRRGDTLERDRRRQEAAQKPALATGFDSRATHAAVTPRHPRGAKRSSPGAGSRSKRQLALALASERREPAPKAAFGP